MQHDDLINAYATGPERLQQAVAGLTREELNTFPVPGTWSMQQICVHLLHSELFAVARMCQIIAEDVPLLMNWDEHTFIARLRYESMAIDDVVNCIALMRKTMTATLRQLKDEDFGRYGIHSKQGKVSLLDVLTKYTNHLDRHLKYLGQKRELMQSANDLWSIRH